MFVGDVHLNCGGLSPYVESALKSVLALVEKEKPDKLVFLGDILDNPALNPDLAKELSTTFRNFQKAAGKVYLIRGNHDKMPRHSRSSIDFLEEQGVVTGFDIYEDDEMILVSHSVSGVSLNPNGKIVAAHLGIKDVEVVPGYTYSNKDVLTLEGEAKLVVLGHVHTPTVTSLEDTTVVLPGSICPSNWADVPDQRWVIIVNDNTVTRLPIDHIRTKTIYNINEMLSLPNTIYRLVLKAGEGDKIPSHESIKSVVIRKDVKPIVKGSTKESLITLYCKQFGVDELVIKRILVEAGVHA